jgi:hypothetical protein
MQSMREISSPASKSMHSSTPLLPVGTEALDRTELRIREILFQQRASLVDAEVPPSLTRMRRAIRIDGVISSPVVRIELAHALEAIPHTFNEIKSAVSINTLTRASKGATAVINKPDGGEIVEPPLLRKRLVQTLGSEREATQFANRILEESGKSFALTVQLHELARRFSLSEEQRLPASLRMELGNLSHEMESALRKQLIDESDLLVPALGNEAQLEPEVDPDWHTRADTLFRLAVLKEKTVSRLFAVTSHAPSIETSVDAEVSQLRKCTREMIAFIPAVSAMPAQQ